MDSFVKALRKELLKSSRDKLTLGEPSPWTRGLFICDIINEDGEKLDFLIHIHTGINQIKATVYTFDEKLRKKFIDIFSNRTSNPTEIADSVVKIVKSRRKLNVGGVFTKLGI